LAHLESEPQDVGRAMSDQDPNSGFPTEATVECSNPDCKKAIVVSVPQPEITNKLTFSAVVFAHPEPQFCPHCGAAHGCAIAVIGDIRLRWGLMPSKRDANLIKLAPPGVKLPPMPSGGNKH